MKIRYTQPDDWKQLQEMYDGMYFYHKKALLETISKKRFLVAEENNEIAGVLNIGAKYDKILMLIVKEKYRHQGIAKKLFKTAQAIYKTKTIWIDATIESIEFWKGLGFQKTGKIKKTRVRSLTNMVYNL